MSFTALSLRDALGLPTLASINLASFVSYVLPAVLSYLGVAVLAIMPRTQSLRIALWPLVALLALRAALSFDFSSGNPHGVFQNVQLMSLSSDASVPQSQLRPVIMDALDLALNIRGYGWDYSKRLRVPRETRPLSVPDLLAVRYSPQGHHAFIWGIVHKAFPCTIFDETLPFFIRYFRSTIITIIFLSSVYCNLQMIYNLCIIPAVLVLGQDPAQWPPAFDSHGWQHLLTISGREDGTVVPTDVPLSRWGSALTRLRQWGSYLGRFLASGVCHWIMILPFNAGVELWRMMVPFGMIGVGAVGERMFLQWTDRRVEGLTGWVWR
ncbi:hypothetical protein BU15DRAFT_59143 [Melanogaster broomeanus]|nr:hypothetical protein BU15DRAFT_59143 [Melanogaster broomeanus]